MKKPAWWQLANISSLLLFLLLMLPSATLWWVKSQGSIGISEIMLWVSFLLTLAWFVFLENVFWLSCLMFIPAAALAPLASYYVLHYHHPAGVAALGAMAATSIAEAQQFFAGNLIWMLLACVFCGVFAIFTLYCVRRAKLRCSKRARLWVAWFALAGLFYPAIYGVFSPSAKSSHNRQQHGAFKVAVGYEVSGINKWLVPSFPLGWPARVAQYIQYDWRVHRRVDQLTDFRFGAHLTTPLSQRQVYVLVIGESSQRGHWQLFGYSRPTNPKLSQLPNLVPIDRMVAAYPFTIGALPVMLTRKPAKMPFDKPWGEPSIVGVMAEAGFSTWWISNQYPLGPYDSTVAVFAHEAQHLEWLNYANYGSPGKYDGDLVAGLKHALSTSTGNIFVVLHMLGSHRVYDYRYPPSFRQFTPTRLQQGTNVPLWKRFTNSYDNTIVYSDHVLAAIIGTLRKSGAVAALWYASDHGETLPTSQCDEGQHGHGNRAEFQIPALFWYSNAYKRAFPQRVTRLKKNAGQRTMTENTFPTLVDMAGITFPGHSKRADWSLFNAKWHYHPRWVSLKWHVDFDRAQPHGACGSMQPVTKGEQGAESETSGAASP